jgi:hypothetical protein
LRVAGLSESLAVLDAAWLGFFYRASYRVLYPRVMTAETFREILKRSPFELFRIVMSSGESYNIMHPEHVLVTARSLVLALPDPTHPEGERLAFCSYLHIAHIEILKPSRAA